MAKQKKYYTVVINASREKVWQTLWDDATYREWTSAFGSGSHAVTDWQKGSKVLFLGSEDSGMVSRIAESIPNEYMSFEHLGEIKNGVEDTTSERVQQWAGSTENYTLKTTDAGTELVIDIDISDEFLEMFDAIWPKALAKLKDAAERP